MKAGVCILALVVLVPSVFSSDIGDPYPHEPDLIEVMFQHEAVMRLVHGEPVDLSGTGSTDGVPEVLTLTDCYSWERITEVSEERLDELEDTGETRTGQDLYSLNNIFRLRFTGDIDPWELSRQLEALPGVMLARPVPLPCPPPQPPDYQGLQGYLDPASNTPAGIDALHAWTWPGGDGTSVTVCDLEYSWNYSHADLSKAVGSQINSNVADPFADNNHGTAVIGELVSDNNGWGTIGICHGSGLATCGTYYGLPSPSWNVPGAMAVAISALSAGDVILLEQQWDYTGSGGYIPIEWWLNYSPNPQTYNGVYAAIQTAVANGIHVVQAGGNGNYNTDMLSWLGNSGAMIVGAGGAHSSGDLKRMSFSSYGTRFDLQGWGENVVTTGYGSLYNAMGTNYFYASGFSGTSSASPIVAGAAACCVGFWVANGNPPATLTPSLLRWTLVNTGTPQVTPPAGNIGPRPDLFSAFGYLTTVGIAEEEAADSGLPSSLSVSPNPACGAVTLTLSSPGAVPDGTVRIFDLSGRLVDSVSIPRGSDGDWAMMTWEPDAESGTVARGVHFATALTADGPVSCGFVLMDRTAP